MKGGKLSTPINKDGTGNGFTLSNGMNGGELVTLVDDNGMPIAIGSGGGGTGSVSSVNSKTGVVVLTSDDIDYTDIDGNTVSITDALDDLYNSSGGGTSTGFEKFVNYNTPITLTNTYQNVGSTITLNNTEELTIKPSGMFAKVNLTTAGSGATTPRYIFLQLVINGVALDSVVDTLFRDDTSTLFFTNFQTVTLPINTTIDVKLKATGDIAGTTPTASGATTTMNLAKATIYN